MAKELNCKWYFAEAIGGQDQGPNEAMSETFKKVPYDALVREAIQNSLDARKSPLEPVVVDFNFGRISKSDFPNFSELKYHILGCIQQYNTDTSRSKFQPMASYLDESFYIDYLAVKDSNTFGMNYETHTTSSAFYSFVKCAGNSSKASNTAGGSFGFGKAAYFNISKLKTLLVSTMTPDGKVFFEGVSSLCTHKFNNAGKYVPVGYYCNNANEESINDVDEIPEMFRQDVPGTSVFMMGIDYRDMSKEEIILDIIKSALFNFWCAILKRKLVVRINDGAITIDNTNVESYANHYFSDFDEESRPSQAYNPRPYLDAVAHANQDDKHIEIELDLAKLGKCSFFVLKRKKGTDNIVYMRQPRMVVYSQKNNTNFGFYGVFVCKNNRGNELLRSIEDPSHREWDHKRLNGKEEKKYAREALKELREKISDALRGIFMAADVDHIDIKGLEEYLYIPTSYDDTFEDYDSEPWAGVPTGKLLDEGTSFTTNIPEDGGPKYEEKPESSSAGHVIIKRSSTATPSDDGDLRSGHGTKPRKNTKGGVPMPGDRKQGNIESEEGSRGYFAQEIDVPYRSFSQKENGSIVHYIILHSPDSIDQIRLRFMSIGEEKDEELLIKTANVGTIKGCTLDDLFLVEGKNKLRLQFADNMKHSIKITAEELIEL